MNASPPPMAPASDEERQAAFQFTFPHVRLCLSLQWIFDCILHQRLMGINKDNTGYVKVHVPHPPISHNVAGHNDDSDEDDAEDDVLLLSHVDGDEMPTCDSNTALRTPLNNTTVTTGGFFSSPQGVGIAENDGASEADVSPARSTTGGGGRLSSGSRKKRMGPQSAVKDPDLQLSTQQLLLPSQASLHAMAPQFDEDE